MEAHIFLLSRGLPLLWRHLVTRTTIGTTYDVVGIYARTPLQKWTTQRIVTLLELCSLWISWTSRKKAPEDVLILFWLTVHYDCVGGEMQQQSAHSFQPAIIRASFSTRTEVLLAWGFECAFGLIPVSNMRPQLTHLKLIYAYFWQSIIQFHIRLVSKFSIWSWHLNLFENSCTNIKFTILCHLR